jgi:hypothetical protein
MYLGEVDYLPDSRLGFSLNPVKAIQSVANKAQSVVQKLAPPAVAKLSPGNVFAKQANAIASADREAQALALRAAQMKAATIYAATAASPLGRRLVSPGMIAQPTPAGGDTPLRDLNQPIPQLTAPSYAGTSSSAGAPLRDLNQPIPQSAAPWYQTQSPAPQWQPDTSATDASYDADPTAYDTSTLDVTNAAPSAPPAPSPTSTLSPGAVLTLLAAGVSLLK